MKKVNRLDIQITFLESLGSTISAMEMKKLENLKERQRAMVEAGIELIATEVPYPPTRKSRMSNQQVLREKDVPVTKKKKYQEVSNHEDANVGELGEKGGKKEMSAEAKERKRVRDNLYQKSKKEKKKTQEMVNREMLERMIAVKIEKRAEMSACGDQLEKKLVSLNLEIQAVEKMISEREKSEAVMKEKFRLVYRHQSRCMKY